MKAKKSLGQNFLINKNYALKATESAMLSTKDTVLEIGPGKGFLTEEILKHAEKVVAIEKDVHLYELLKEKFLKEIRDHKLELIYGDALDFDPSIYNLIQGKYKIIANIPYNITGKIIQKFLEEERNPHLMILMLQKEVAKRIIARDNKESILSISVKIFSEPKYITTVKAGNFNPKPKVDSALIGFFNIDNKIGNFEKKLFFKIVKVGFSKKRKKLIKNLEEEYEIDLKPVFSKLNLSENIRAEELTVEMWIQLTQEIHES